MVTFLSTRVSNSNFALKIST